MSDKAITTKREQPWQLKPEYIREKELERKLAERDEERLRDHYDRFGY